MVRQRFLISPCVGSSPAVLILYLDLGGEIGKHNGFRFRMLWVQVPPKIHYSNPFFCGFSETPDSDFWVFVDVYLYLSKHLFVIKKINCIYVCSKQHSARFFSFCVSQVFLIQMSEFL